MGKEDFGFVFNFRSVYFFTCNKLKPRDDDKTDVNSFRRM